MASLSERLKLLVEEGSALGLFAQDDRSALDLSNGAAGGAAADGAADLRGKLVGVKANIAVSGKSWTAGLEARRDTKAKSDAALVSRLREAGSLIVPGLAMDEAAFGATCDNPFYGRCLNPLDRRHSPGGSSGGSACAVSAGLVDFAIGTDTLGSVRIPAAYCGVAGLKPTAGLVPMDGVFPLSETLDTVGPLARRVRGLRSITAAIAGRMPPPTREKRGADLAGVTVGIPAPVFQVECEDAVRTAYEHARSALARGGASLVPVPMEGWDPSSARRAALVLLEMEGADALADYLGDSSLASEGLKAAMAYGRGVSAEKRAEIGNRISTAKDACLNALESVDVLMLPTTPHRAPAHDTAPPANQADFTALANLAGIPAVCLPVHVEGSHLPASVQLVGRSGADFALLDWATVLDEMLNPGSG